MQSKAERRRELEDAIANVRRQLNIDETTVGYMIGGEGPNAPTGHANAIATLRETLAGLEETLADLDAEE